MNEIIALSDPAINWPVLIKLYEQSGLNRKQFCKENNLSLLQFKYYRAKLKRQTLTPNKKTLVPITLKETPAVENTVADNTFQVTFKNGIYCQIPLHLHAEKLKALMAVLQSC